MRVSYAKLHQPVQVGVSYYSHLKGTDFNMNYNAGMLEIELPNEILIIGQGNIENVRISKDSYKGTSQEAAPIVAESVEEKPRRGRPPGAKNNE